MPVCLTFFTRNLQCTALATQPHHLLHPFRRSTPRPLCAADPAPSPPASLQALHPTPAVCGRPRDQALGYLDAHERFDRGLYSGPFGWISGAGAEFVVAIRSALVQPDAVSPATGSGPSPSAPRHDVHLYAGVGVVLGSDPAEEWQELELKTRQYRQLLLPPRLRQLQAAAADPAAIKARPLREWLRGLPNINLAWCSLLVEELCRQGVTMFCIAPGESVWGVCGCVRVCAGVCRGCLHKGLLLSLERIGTAQGGSLYI